MKNIEYKKLFEPITIASLKVPNRISLAPMGIGTLCTDEGGFSERAIELYAEIARGGTGLIMTGMFKVENEIEKLKVYQPPRITHNPQHFVSTATELTERVHAYGTKIFIQLSAGFGRSINPSEKILAVQPVAPSAIPAYWNPSVTCRALETEEVERIVHAFGNAAEMAVSAGFDGIDIHAVHEGYLIDQFTIALFNRRTDKYGGDLRGRLTFPIEIVQEIKKRIGKRYPVSLRFSVKSYIKDWNQGGLPGEDFKELGRDTDEGLKAALLLEEAGYDAFNADAGTYDAWYWAHPPLYQKHGCNIDVVEKLKQVVHVPVMVAGRMDLPDLAEEAIRTGKSDIVSIGRGLLAEPHWPKKVMRGAIDTIRPCLACHDGCFLRILTKGPLSCAVNPSCGRESKYALQPATEIKNVIVVGGGVAGMEAARVAAIRGHKVALYEKSDKLGGHVIAASTPDFKEDDVRLLNWYRRELNSLKIEINLNTQVTSELIEKKKPQAVIIATGSQPVVPDVQGIDKGHVSTAIDILLGKKKTGDTVIIVGGGLIGCETALWLAQQGKKVTVVEMLADIMCAGLPVHHANRTMLIDLLKYHGVKIITGNSLLEVTDDSAVIIDQCLKRTTLKADSVVVAIGLRPDNELYRSIRNKFIDLYLIGDASKAGKIMNAIWDAYEVARTL